MMKKNHDSPSISQAFPTKKPRSDSYLPRSETPPSSPGPAGDVSPICSPPSPISPPVTYCESQSERLVDEWGDTFVEETPPDLDGDVAAGEPKAAWFSGVPSPAGDGNLSGRPSGVLTTEERKQEVWEEKMHQMLARMHAKRERQNAEKAVAVMAVEREEMEWDAKIEGMLARMKAKDLKSKASFLLSFKSKDAIFGKSGTILVDLEHLFFFEKRQMACPLLI